MLPDEASKAPSIRPDLFLKGPIPLPWLAVAATLPGKALAVGIIIWFLQGIQKKSYGETGAIVASSVWCRTSGRISRPQGIGECSLDYDCEKAWREPDGNDRRR